MDESVSAKYLKKEYINIWSFVPLTWEGEEGFCNNGGTGQKVTGS